MSSQDDKIGEMCANDHPLYYDINGMLNAEGTKAAQHWCWDAQVKKGARQGPSKVPVGRKHFRKNHYHTLGFDKFHAFVLRAEAAAQEVMFPHEAKEAAAKYVKVTTVLAEKHNEKSRNEKNREFTTQVREATDGRFIASKYYELTQQ
jgi:hypothetical protein